MSRAGLFPTVKTAGALLPSDILVRIQAGASGGLPGLRGEDYGLAAGETVENAAARAWTYLLTTWTSFQETLAALPEGDRAVQVTRQRWLLVLLRELGFGTLTPSHGVELDDGTRVPVSHEWHDVPLHLLGWNVPLDIRTPGLAGAATASPQSMVQELLNRSDERLWAVLSNGRVLRILRDSTTLVGAAYVEFDLEAMLSGEAFADFRLLFALCHASRFTPPGGGDGKESAPASCWLERWRTEAIQTGTRALAQLGAGVENALGLLGRGLVAHPDNVDLREDLASGRIPVASFQHGLLRLVYRLLFLFVVEERGALHPPGSDPVAVRRYRDHYSGARLRHLSRVRHGGSHGDLWQGLSRVLGALGGDGEKGLALPALAGLFDPADDDLPPDLSLANEALLAAVRALSWVRDRGGPWRPVDYRNLGAEELGSIYESLLEMVADVDLGAREVRLRRLAGNERKTTGSYYTPADLIALVLDEALDPLLDDAVMAAKDTADAERRLLGLTVCDPACGSGHFLVAAARRIARRIAALRTGEAEPPPDVIGEALHEVVEHCIYGVDVNPLAAELAKVSLWLEAAAPGRPLSFLDAHVKSGNSLLGATPALLTRGVPDGAFAAITGDDKRVAAELKKANADYVKRGIGFAGRSKVRYEQAELVEGLGQAAVQHTLELDRDGLAVLRSLQQRAQPTAAETRRLAREYREAARAPDVVAARIAADAWCAAFVQPKPAEWFEHVDGLTCGITSRTVALVADRGPDVLGPDLKGKLDALADQYRFFHWHLEFPEIFAQTPDTSAGTGWDGGFACVVGNPPWERIKLQDEEFFTAVGRDDIAKAGNAAKRKKAIAALADDEAGKLLFEQYLDALRRSEGASLLVRAGGRYPLCGRGDINTYSVFAETFRTLIEASGQAGIITPTGLATDNTTAPFFADLLARRSLNAFYDFENEAKIFPGVHNQFRFAATALAGPHRDVPEVRLAFYTRFIDNVPARRFRLTPAEITLLNPNTGTLPVFRSRRDADVCVSAYRRHPILLNDSTGDNPWGLSFLRLLDMANDSGLFRSAEDLDPANYDGWAYGDEGSRRRPLYEAKLLSHWDHRYATYHGATQEQLNKGTLPRISGERHDDPDVEPLVRYWVDEKEVDERLKARWDRGWLLGWRDIARASDARTFVPCVFPRSAVGDKFLLALPAKPTNAVCLHATWSSLIFDYVARQKISGTGMKYFLVKQLACPTPQTFDQPAPWVPAESLRDWVVPRVIELSYTSWRLKPYAEDNGVDGPPFRWLPERREVLRAELDAAMFHVYGLPREDVEHVLDSFFVVRKYDERDHGEFRTKRLVLAEYDRMAAAIAAGDGWASTLTPAPGQGPRHPAR